MLVVVWAIKWAQTTAPIMFCFTSSCFGEVDLISWKPLCFGISFWVTYIFTVLRINGVCFECELEITCVYVRFFTTYWNAYLLVRGFVPVKDLISNKLSIDVLVISCISTFRLSEACTTRVLGVCRDVAIFGIIFPTWQAVEFKRAVDLNGYHPLM